jgi:predicted deacylase
VTETRPRSVEALEVNDIPRGTETRLLVRLVHDGLGHALRVPVVVARGKKDGPVLGITAAVHGNELNGIPVIHRLLDRVDLQKLRGTIAAVVVANVPGYLAYQREFIDGTDLNHVMPGAPDGNVAQVYAHRFIHRVVKQFDYLVDLHTASFGRVNSLYIRADLNNETTARMAYLQRPQIILHDPPSDYTLRGTAMDMDIPAITVEIRDPQRFQKDSIRRTLTGLRAIMAEVGMISRRKTPDSERPILCKESQWLYTNRGGLLEVFPDVADFVEEDQVIARVSSVFGDVVEEYKAPSPGVIIGKSSNPVAQTGARILHLGSVVEPDQFPLARRPIDDLPRDG